MHRQALWCTAAERRTPKHQMRGWSRPGAPRLSKCEQQRRILSLMNSSFIFIWLTESKTWLTLVHKCSYKCERWLSSLCRCDERKKAFKTIFTLRMLGWVETKMASVCPDLPTEKPTSGFASGLTETTVQGSLPPLSDWLHFQFVTLIRNKWSLFPKLYPVSNQKLQLEVEFSHKHQAHHYNQRLDSRE